MTQKSRKPRKSRAKKSASLGHETTLSVTQTTTTLLCGLLLFSYDASAAMPGANDGQFVAGSGTINGVANGLQINQDSLKGVIDWNKFGIDANKAIEFMQSAGDRSITLNRVTGNESSQILGQLTANGRIFIVNPNGILFGSNSKVDVAGLVATTFDISNKDFMENDTYTFTQGDTTKLAAVVNKGEITIKEEGGFAYLIANGVENTGMIVASAKKGNVVLASGTATTLDFAGNGLVNFQVSGEVVGEVVSPDGSGTPVDGVSNKGKIEAKSGQVVLSAQAAKDVMTSVVNNSGTIEAGSFDDLLGGGSVKMEARGTKNKVTNSGKISVSGGKAKGGSVKIKGAGVDMVSASDIDASSELEGGTVTIEGTEGDVATGGKISVSSKTKAGSVSIKGKKNVAQTAAIDASSADGTGGTVTIEGTEGNVANSGKITVSGKTAAGSASLKSGVDITQTAEIDASSAEGTGGTVTIEGTAGTVVNKGVIKASGKTKAGAVSLKGKNVGNFSSIDASSGESNGGSITMDATEAVALGDGSSLTANAGGANGNGGSIKVTGGTTARIGTGVTLQAKGGSTGGNGGSIETTAGTYMSIGSGADVSRTLGNAGTWLIKSKSFSINNTSGSGVTESGAFDIGSGDSSLHVDSILAALKNGNVTVTATENITVNTEIKYVGSDKDSSIDANLTFDAGSNITISHDISSVGTKYTVPNPDYPTDPKPTIEKTSDPAKLNLVFKAGGAVTLAVDTNITTGGGSFTSSGAASFTMANGSTINTGAGSISISNTGTLALTNLTAGKQITISGANGIDITGTIKATDETDGKVSITAETGSITTSGAGIIEANSLDLVTKGTTGANIGKVTYSIDPGGNKIVTTSGLKVKVKNLSASTKSGVDGEISTGNIIIDNSADGDLTLGWITTNGDKGANDIASVFITSTGGGIIGEGTGTHIDAYSVSLAAKNDIILNTNMSAFKGETTYSGSIDITNTSDNLFILGAIAREYGYEATITGNRDVMAMEKNADGTSITHRDGTKNVSIKTKGDIGILGNISATNNLTLVSEEGSILLFNGTLPNGQGGSSGILPILTSRNLSLTAKGSVGTSGGSLRTITGNRMDITSGTLAYSINGETRNVGGIYIEEVNRLNIGTITAEGSLGNVELTSGGGVNVYFAHADSKITAKEGIVKITSSTGTMTTVASNTGTVIEAKGAVLNAKSIGEMTKAIKTKLDTLDVTASDASSGQIYVDNDGNLSAIKVSTPGGVVGINTTGVNLTFNNEVLSVIDGTSTSLDFANTLGSIKVGGINLGTNALTLTAEKSLTQASGQLIAGDVTLSVGDHIGTSESHLKTKVSSLNLTSGKGGIYIDNESNSPDGSLKLEATASGDSSNIWIEHKGTGAMSITKVTSARGGVTLKSGGSILNGYQTSGSVNIKGNSLSLTAGGSIGVIGNALTTNISKSGTNADFSVTAQGEIVINNSGNIKLDASTSGKGDIIFTNSGSIALGAVNAGEKNVTLKANGGSMTDANGDATNITAKNLTLLANSIGTDTDKLEIEVDKLDVTTTNGALYLKQIRNTPFYLAYATVSGTASVESQGTILLGVVDARGQNVILKSETGDILDGREPGEKNANVKAKTLDISGKSLGTGDKGLALDVDVLNASSSSGGSVFAENLGALQVTKDSLTGKGAGQTVSITASSITVFDNNGGITELDNNGSLRLIAKNGNIIFLNSNDTIKVTGDGSIYLEALGTQLPAEETGLVGLIVAGNLITEGGDITLKASSHISINLLSTGRSKGTVTVQSGGQIIDNNGNKVNIIAKNVYLSGRTSTAGQLDDDKKVAESDLTTRITNLQTQIQMKGYSKELVDQYNLLVLLYLEKYGSSQSKVENTENNLSDAQSTLKALEITFKVLSTALDAANLAISIVEIPAGAAQAIPMVGDGGSALVLGILKSVIAGMQLGVNAAESSVDVADGKVGDLELALNEAQSEMYTNKELLDTTTSLLNTHKSQYTDLTDKVDKATIATAASRIIKELAYKAAENNNVVGTASQALGVEADNVNVTANGQSNVYLESSTNIGLGDIKAQGKDTVIEVTAKDNINLTGTSTSSKNIVLYSRDGAITAGSNSKLVTGDLVAVAKNGIGTQSDTIKTQVKRIAAATENGGAYFVNSTPNEALSIDEIAVNTSNLSKTVTGISAKDDVLVETTGDLVLNKAVRNTSKAGTVTLTSNEGSITGVADTAATANHVEGGTLVASAATGIGTGEVALRTDIGKLTGEVTGDGLVNIAEKDAVELTDVSTANGSISVNAGGSIDAKKVVSTTDAEGNIITLTASNGNITAGAITAGKTHGDISLTASEGQVNNDANTATRITGHDLVISAKSGIGAGGTNATTSLDTDVTSLDATTATGVINISESDDLDVVNASTGDGNITIANAAGDLNITLIEAKGTGNTVTLKATGAITDATEDEVTAIIKAANLAATAGTGIGSATNGIELNVDKLEARTTSGGIYIKDLDGDLQIGGVTPNLGMSALTGLEAGTGDIVVKTAGGMNVTEAIKATDGDIVMTAEDGDLTTTADITATNGDIELTATDNITTDGKVSANNDVVMTAKDGSITAKKAVEAKTGNVKMTAWDDVTTNDTVTAGNDVNIIAKIGDITTDKAITATAGNVKMLAETNVTTKDTVTAGKNVNIEATAGDLTTFKAIDAQGEDVTLFGRKSVTTKDTVTAAKNVYITAQYGSITADKAIAAKAGDVKMVAWNDVATNDTVTADKNVLIEAKLGNILAKGAITAANENVELTANTNITTEETVTAKKNVKFNATSGSISATGAVTATEDDVTMNAGTNITTIGKVTANDNVMMTARAGAISTTGDVTATLDNVTMTAGTNITTIGKVTANDHVAMTAKNGNILSQSAIKATTGNVTMTASEDVTTEETVDADLNVVITATKGDIWAKKAITAANDNVTLTAGSDITTNGKVTANDDVAMMAKAGNILSTASIQATLGNVDMTANADVNTQDTVTAAKNVKITATTGNITADKAITATTEDVTLTAQVDVTTNDTVNAGKNVLITATDGNILAEGAITAANDNVELTAGTNITTNGTVSAADDVKMVAEVDVVTNNTVMAGNNVDITATTGNITADKAITATTEDVTMLAKTNVTTNDTVNAGKNVLITATDGNILAKGAITAANDNVELTAGTNITTNGTVTAADDVKMKAEAGDITTTAAIKATLGNVNIDAGADMTIGSTVTADKKVDLVAGNDMAINGAVTANKEDVTMKAEAGDITTTAAIKATLGNVNMDAGVDMTIGSTVTADKKVDLVAGNDMAINGAVTANKEDVKMKAEAGDITTTAAILAKLGNVNMDAGADMTIGSTVTADKKVDLVAGKGIAINGAVTANKEDVTMTAKGGNIATTAAIKAIAGSVNMGASENIVIGRTIAGRAIMDETVTAGTDVNLVADKGITINAAVTAQNDVTMQAKDGDITTKAQVAATTGDVGMDASANVTIGQTVTAEAGNISMLASNGNITLNDTVKAANGNVTLEATKGLIQGATNKPPVYHVVTKVLNAIAAKGINLRTNIQELVGKLTGKGNVVIDQTGDLLADVTTADGAITVTASGTIDAKNIVSLTDTDANDITLTSSNANILVGKIEAGQGKNADVILTAQNGSVTAKRPSGSPIVADALVVNAKSNIDLDTKVNSADLVVTNDGRIAINETDDLVLKAKTKGKGNISVVAGGELEAVGVVAGNGSIDLTARKDVIATNVVSTTNALGNDITITSKERDIVVDSIVAGTGTGGNVTLKAENGVIRESDPKDTGIDVIGNTVNFHAKGNIGVGSQGGLDIKVQNLNAYSAQGNISLAAVANVIVQELHARNGNIKLTSGGAILDDNNDATRIIARDLILEAVSGIGTQGAAATRALDTEVKSMAASVSGLGDINILQKGDLEIRRVTTSNGNITMIVDGAIGLDYMAANGSGKMLTLKARNGAIIDNNDIGGDKKLNISADKVVIEGSKGVGTRDNAIEISTSEITGNGGSGGLYVDHSRDKVVIGEYVTNGGDIVMTAPGEMVINSPIQNYGNGNIYITITNTGRDDDNLIINAGINTTGNGSIYLNVDDYIYQNSNIAVENWGNIEVIAGKAIYMGNTATTTAELGNIVYRAKDEIVLGKVKTSVTHRGGTITVDANVIKNGNASGEFALQGGYISIITPTRATRNLVHHLIGGVDSSYGMWLNNRLVGGLVSRDAEFIGKPCFENSRQDLGYKLYQANDRNANPLIDSSSYEKKGFVYDEKTGSWVLVL